MNADLLPATPSQLSVLSRKVGLPVPYLRTLTMGEARYILVLSQKIAKNEGRK